MIRLTIISLAFFISASCSETTKNEKPVSKSLNPTEISITLDTIINFENNEAGNIIKGFTQTSTGKAQTIRWKITEENGNKIAFQTAKNRGEYFNLLILKKSGYKNFTANVKIKAVSGKEDQGGGIVWRYIDDNNYYTARYNPLENNFRLYRVVNGHRRQIKSSRSNIKRGEWFTMKIEMNGNKIVCSLNGKKLIETTDNTFRKTGKIGLWTKADAQTYFDDLTIHTDKN